MTLLRPFLAAVLAVPALAGLAALPAQANIERNPSWGRLPPAGRQPQVVITYLATGGHQLFCYGDSAIGNRDTWWCFNPGNSVEGFLHVTNTEWVLYNRDMSVRCQFRYDGNAGQPFLRAGQQGWGGRGFCAGRQYDVHVVW